MPTKFFRTKKKALAQKKKIGKPGVVMNKTSPVWRKGDKRRKGKNWVVRY